MKDELFYEDISTLVASVSSRTLRMKTSNVKLLNRIGFELNHILTKINDIVRIYQADKNEFINEVDLIQRDYIDLSRKIDERFSRPLSSDEVPGDKRSQQPQQPQQTNLQRILNTSNSSVEAYRNEESPVTTPSKLKKKKKKPKAQSMAKTKSILIPDTCVVDTQASYTPRKVCPGLDQFVVRETVDEETGTGKEMVDRFEMILSDLEKSQEAESIENNMVVCGAGRRISRIVKSPNKGASSTPLAVRKELQAHGLLDMTNEQDTLTLTTQDSSVPSPKQPDTIIKRPDKTKTPVKYLMLDMTPNKSPSLIFKSVGEPVATKPSISSLADKLPKKVFTPSTDKTFKSQFDLYNEIPSPAKKQPAAKKQRLKQLTMSQAFAGQSTKINTPATPNTRDLDETCLTTQFESPQVKFANGTVKDEPMEFNHPQASGVNKKNDSLNSQLKKIKSEPIDERIGDGMVSPCELRRSPCRSEFFADFDKVPKKKDDGPGFKHVAVVRKHDERKKLTTSSCRECENYWNSLPEDKRPQRMDDLCRHRAKYQAPDTPEHYWSISFPNTQDCIDRGYGGVLVESEQASSAVKRPRRKRPLKAACEVKKRKGDAIQSPDNSDFDFGYND